MYISGILSFQAFLAVMFVLDFLPLLSLGRPLEFFLGEVHLLCGLAADATHPLILPVLFAACVAWKRGTKNIKRTPNGNDKRLGWKSIFTSRTHIS